MKRFDPIEYDDQGVWRYAPANLKQFDDGEWVSYEDAQAEITRLKASNKELVEALRGAKQFIAKLKRNYTPEPIPANSDSGLDWDTLYHIENALKKRVTTFNKKRSMKTKVTVAWFRTIEIDVDADRLTNDLYLDEVRLKAAAEASQDINWKDGFITNVEGKHKDLANLIER